MLMEHWFKCNKSALGNDVILHSRLKYPRSVLYNLMLKLRACVSGTITLTVTGKIVEVYSVTARGPAYKLCNDFVRHEAWLAEQVIISR